jgi:AraC-like DNA-binding protein
MKMVVALYTGYIRNLYSKLCIDNECFVMRAKDTIEHIFSDLYNIPPSIQETFFRLKILELLLFLSAIDVSGCRERCEYFPKQLVETIKRIKNRITNEPEKRHTIEELAEEYDISRTALKSCFKGIYGTSIGEYMKHYRMQTAAALLKETNRSVLEIAKCVGYENQSRFAAAFKGAMGKSPLQYRKIGCPNGLKAV